MLREVYYIDEEFYNEDMNDSVYRPLKRLAFGSREEAEEYMERYFKECEYEQIEKRFHMNNNNFFIITDKTFHENQEYKRYYFVRKLKLHK